MSKSPLWFASITSSHFWILKHVQSANCTSWTVLLFCHPSTLTWTATIILSANSNSCMVMPAPLPTAGKAALLPTLNQKSSTIAYNNTAETATAAPAPLPVWKQSNINIRQNIWKNLLAHIAPVRLAVKYTLLLCPYTCFSSSPTLAKNAFSSDLKACVSN